MPASDLSDTVLVLASAGLGQGDPSLSRKVLGNYLRALAEMPMKPQAIVCYTDGVKLLADDSPVVPELTALVAAGVPVIGCRTCLDHHGLTARVAVGEIGSIAQVIELQAHAAKVVTL